jgi:hypothetical protein
MFQQLTDQLGQAMSVAGRAVKEHALVVPIA